MGRTYNHSAVAGDGAACGLGNGLVTPIILPSPILGMFAQHLVIHRLSLASASNSGGCWVYYCPGYCVSQWSAATTTEANQCDSDNRQQAF